MAEVKERNVTRQDAYQLAHRMADNETANYLIRDALAEKGFTIHEANEIIDQMRQLRLKMKQLEVKDSQGFF